MMAEQKDKITWWKKFVNKYNELCKELGVEQGACRSCTPIVKADENGNLLKKDEKNN